MSRNPPPPRRMVHSVMSEMRDKVDLELKGKKAEFNVRDEVSTRVVFI